MWRASFNFSWDFFITIASLLYLGKRSDLCAIGHHHTITLLCSLSTEDTVPKKVVCHFNGKTYADEERWDIDSCTHCYCLQGQTLCSTVSCPPLPCAEPINVEGSCCPMCPGNVMWPPRLLYCCFPALIIRFFFIGFWTSVHTEWCIGDYKHLDFRESKWQTYILCKRWVWILLILRNTDSKSSCLTLLSVGLQVYENTTVM